MRGRIWRSEMPAAAVLTASAGASVAGRPPRGQFTWVEQAAEAVMIMNI